MRIRTNRHNFELSPDTKEIVAELSDGSPEETNKDAEGGETGEYEVSVDHFYLVGTAPHKNQIHLEQLQLLLGQVRVVIGSLIK